MPLYEYQCESCNRRFERIQKFSDPPVDTCPFCSGRVKKLLSTPAIQFKGSGWYITDYAKKSGGESKSAAAGDEKKTTESTSTKSESQSDTTAAKPADSK
jgi:putative FmdB family regulatory protein